MEVRRLSWAGVEIQSGDLRILLDPLDRASHLESFMGAPRGEIVAPEARAADLVLVTHRHPDHYDPDTLGRSRQPEGEVFCPQEIVEQVRKDGFRAQGLVPYESVERGGIAIHAVPAVDGLGEAQLSWIVEGEGRRLIHCGDTLWHGHWWRIARRYGPFALAFLPINGAVAAFPGMVASGIAASLTPEQAAAAAQILRAERLCPIHYGLFHNPPIYSEHPEAEKRLRVDAEARGVAVLVVSPGEIVP